MRGHPVDKPTSPQAIACLHTDVGAYTPNYIGIDAIRQAGCVSEKDIPRNQPATYQSPGRRGLSAQGDHLDLLMSFRLIPMGRLHCFQSCIRVPIGPYPPNGADHVSDLLVTGPVSYQCLQIMAACREQTRHEFSVGCQSRACTARAKGFGDRSDYTDVSSTIDDLVIHRWRAAAPSPRFSQAVMRRDLGENFSLRYDLFG